MTSSMWDKIVGKWMQLKGEIQSRWGKLTDDEVAHINGEREKLAGRLQELYGIAKEEANRQIDEWADALKFD
ncbi:MAG: CsbD family protein [Chloroflexi bacterium CFX4]|nr:CsbD family protein [Chloroflexi bacterium CFX4]MDL1923344.1 CsbD family protein [Chloroflexi bacterium CFX3]